MRTTRRERELINRLGKPVSILRKQIDGVKYHMTMQAFRELLESGTTDNLVEMESKGIDLLDQGGCGCMVDYREGEGE